MTEMSYAGQRTISKHSGACTHCVRHNQRCYIGIQGPPCSRCRLHSIPCDGQHMDTLVYTAEELFASHVHNAQSQNQARLATNPAVPSTRPLDNYVAIVQELLGTQPVLEPSVPVVPPYLARLQRSLEHKDIEYLSRKGALTIPSLRFRRELLKCFLLWVQPSVPIMEINGLFHAMIVNEALDGISLLLFHAVMFAASAFVDIDHVRREGYDSRRAARESLYRRAKALFDLDCEEDRLSHVQAILLMIYWDGPRKGERDAAHWMGTCISLAMSIGLHQDPDPNTMNPSQQRIWKRTWWSMHNHARNTCADLLSMMSIIATESPSIVTIDDFEFHIASYEVRSILGESDVAWSLEYQKVQALVFIEKTKLCRIFQLSTLTGKLKSIVYGDDDSVLERPLAMIDPEQLSWWLAQRCPETAHRLPLSPYPMPWEQSLYVHRTWLRLLYLGAAYLSQCDRVISSASTQDAIELAKKHILSLSNLVEEVVSLNLASALPGCAAPLLILALSFHRQGLATGTMKERIAVAQRSKTLWNVIEELREDCELADQLGASLNGLDARETWERITCLGLFV